MNKIAIEKTELGTFVEKSLVDSFSKIFRVNVNTGKYEVYKDVGILCGEGLADTPDIYAYMQTLIDQKIVYPEYSTVCRRFTNPEYIRKSVFTSGPRRIVQSYRRRTLKGDKWITFTIFVSSNCGPENPMVLFAWREADSDALTLLDTLPTISSLYDKLIRINLTNNTYEPVVVDDDEKEQLVGGVINMYEWWAGYSKDGNIAAEDMGEFSTLTKPGSLQKRFAKDPTPVRFRYRRKIDDEFRWVQLEIAPSVEYSENNQIMLLSLKDIHEEYTAQMRSRQVLIDNMNRDSLTRLYNRLKFDDDIEALKKSDDPVFTCLYIDVNGLHELNNLLGHQKGDDMLCCVADTLKKYFPDEKVYRLGGDEFVVTSIKQSKLSMEINIEKVRLDLSRDNYEISIGIETGVCGENIEKIVEAAEFAMRTDKENYYMRNGDHRRKRQMNEELEQMLIEKNDYNRFLSVISNQFLGVLCVDLESDTSRHIYMPDFFAKLLEKSNGALSEAMRLFAEGYIKSEYHCFFDEILDYDRLDKKLSETGTVQFTYQRNNGTWVDVRILEVDRQPNAKPETIWIFSEKKQR